MDLSDNRIEKRLGNRKSDPTKFCELRDYKRSAGYSY